MDVRKGWKKKRDSVLIREATVQKKASRRTLDKTEREPSLLLRNVKGVQNDSASGISF